MPQHPLAGRGQEHEALGCVETRVDRLAAANARRQAEMLIERTGGNPFFLEEGVRALIETGVIARDRESYRLVKDLKTAQVPPTVQAVLAARIDRLSADEKWLLQSAAVIGRSVPFSLLQAISEHDEDTLRGLLARLQADRKSTRLNSSHHTTSRMPSSA